jgi:hypothetical protein
VSTAAAVRGEDVQPDAGGLSPIAAAAAAAAEAGGGWSLRKRPQLNYAQAAGTPVMHTSVVARGSNRQRLPLKLWADVAGH